MQKLIINLCIKYALLEKVVYIPTDTFYEKKFMLFLCNLMYLLKLT